MKGSSCFKGKTFDQEGSIINPVDVEPLSSALSIILVPYGTSKDEIHVAEGLEKKESYLMEDQNAKSSNLEDNLA